jgi:hypothetical protein
MAKTIQTLSPEFIREIAWAVEQVKRMRPGELRGDVPEPSKAPDDVVVMTPVGGIAARAGTTCYGEDCATYRITDADTTDGEITLQAIVDGDSAALTVEVYNLSNEAVGGSRYVVTSRLKSGHRYVVLESCNAES